MRLLSLAVVAGLLPFAVPAVAAGHGIIKGPVTGCIEKGPMVRARDLRQQDDPLAAQTLMAEGLGSGRCRPFAAGEPIVIEDGDILAGLSKVHSLGDPTPFWVPERAVQFD